LKSHFFFVSGLIGLLILQLMCERVHAEGLKELMQARSAAEFVYVRNQLDQNQRQSLICKTQLKEKRIPTGCFEMRSVDHERLDPLCLDRARSSTRLEELEAAIRSTSLPSECKRLARVRRSDLIYQRKDGPNFE
jgi:hypothetical protein